MASRAPAAKWERRLEIIAVSTKLLERNGYGRTTMDDIAAGAGVTKRTLYRYVPTKQDILPMIHEQFLEAAEERLMRDEPAGDPVRQLTVFIESYIAVVVEHQGAVRVFFEEEYNLSHDARDRIVARRDAFEQRVRQIIRAGAAAEVFGRFDVDMASAGMLGAMASICRWYSPAGTLDVADLADLMSRIFLTGLTRAQPRVATDSGGGAPRIPRAEADIPPPTTAPQPVLAAAVRLFASQGYLETNTREIADAAGVTQSGLFYHIGSKEELLYALHYRFLTQSLDSVAGWAADDVVERLRVFIVEHAGLISAHPYDVRVLVDQVRYLTGPRRAAIAELSARYLDQFENVVRQGIAQGVFEDLHPRVAALAVLGALNSMLRWYRPDGRLSARRIGAILADLLLRGLLVRADAPGAAGF